MPCRNALHSAKKEESCSILRKENCQVGAWDLRGHRKGGGGKGTTDLADEEKKRVPTVKKKRTPRGVQKNCLGGGKGKERGRAAQPY